jgi:hypothetical protein
MMTYAVVTGRSVDGTQYASAFGWCMDVREALLFDPEEAEKWATILEERESKTREPDNGVYQIRAIWIQPHVWTVAELLEMEEENALIMAAYEKTGEA